MKIGDEIYIHGYVHEIADDTVIVRNLGGFFATSRNEIRPNDEDVGKTCYKIYVMAERPRFPKTYYDYKSDRNKLGKTVFWTKEEAEEAIGVVYERSES